MTNVTSHNTIDEAGAEAVLDAAERHGRAHGNRVVIAVVERSGELVALRRTPGAQVASSRVAVDKSRTAAIFVRPSREIEQQVSNGRLGALALQGARALTGGIPLKAGDQVVGAIGTSGETPDEDEAISIAGAAAEYSTSTAPALTDAGARRAAEAVAHECSRRGVDQVCRVLDPQTDAGVDLVAGGWRYSDARVNEIEFVEVGHPDDRLGPGLRPNRTFDVEPHAEGCDYHDLGWRALAPSETQLRLSQGRVCF